MKEDYHVPLTELSATERIEYQKGIKILLGGDSGGLEIALSVLQNSRPTYVPNEPERALSWATEIIGAYRNLGKVIKNIGLSTSESELREKLKKYNDIIPEDNDEAPYQPLFDTLEQFQEIHKILKEHEIENPEQLEEVLGRKEEDKSNEESFRSKLKKFENNF